MKFLHFKKICNKLNFWISLTLLILIVGISIFAIKSYEKYIVDLTDYSLFEQVKDIEGILESERLNTQEQVNISLNLAHNYLFNQGEIAEQSDEFIEFKAQNQISKRTHNAQVKQWLINDQQIQNHSNFVDEIKEQSVETVTIFQKIPEGYLRVSTNVMTIDGKRAVGTYIPNDSPVIKAIEQGETFRGRAFVVNKWYYTAYEPIYINNEIKGILYVGVPDGLLENLASFLKTKQYFKTGYPYVVDQEGVFLLHPSKVGANVGDYDFFKAMLDYKSDNTKLAYMWEGKEKYQYFKFYEPLNAFVSITIYDDDLYSVSNKTRNIILLILVVGVIVFILINRLIINSVVKSLKKGIDITQNIAEGNLNQSIEEMDSQDEVGDFVTALRTMNYKLNEVVKGIRINANDVTESSQQLSADAENLSQSASEQAASVEEITTTIEEINANLDSSASNASYTEEMAKEASSGIAIIKDASNLSMESVNKITNKIEVINDIASQTNILALNAAVEAARAGEHGKGFAVVAAEVRKLSERSKDAATEIISLASDSRRDTEKAFGLLSDILPKIEKTSNLIQEISASTQEQKVGVNQINDAIGQLNDVTQSSAASAEEMAANAENLSSLAASLEELVAFFDTMQQGRKAMSVENFKNPQTKKISESVVKVFN